MGVLEQQLAAAKAARDAAVDPRQRRVRAAAAVRNTEKAVEKAIQVAQSYEEAAVAAKIKADTAASAVARCQNALDDAKQELAVAIEKEGQQLRSEFCALGSRQLVSSSNPLDCASRSRRTIYRSISCLSCNG